MNYRIRIEVIGTDREQNSNQINPYSDIRNSYAIFGWSINWHVPLSVFYMRKALPCFRQALAVAIQ